MPTPAKSKRAPSSAVPYGNPPARAPYGRSAPGGLPMPGAPARGKAPAKSGGAVQTDPLRKPAKKTGR